MLISSKNPFPVSSRCSRLKTNSVVRFILFVCVLTLRPKQPIQPILFELCRNRTEARFLIASTCSRRSSWAAFQRSPTGLARFQSANFFLIETKRDNFFSDDGFFAAKISNSLNTKKFANKWLNKLLRT